MRKRKEIEEEIREMTLMTNGILVQTYQERITTELLLDIRDTLHNRKESEPQNKTSEECLINPKFL